MSVSINTELQQNGNRNSSPYSEPQTPIGPETCNEAGQELNPWRDRQGQAGGRIEARASELS